MAEKIPGEVISPCIKDGIIYWHFGDCFDLHLKLNLYSMGEEYELSEDECIAVVFYDSGGVQVYSFLTPVEDNVATLNFDKSITGLFDKGRYTYDITVEFQDGKLSTIADDNVAIVL